jgi:hypothetical protein
MEVIGQLHAWSFYLRNKEQQYQLSRSLGGHQTSKEGNETKIKETKKPINPKFH